MAPDCMLIACRLHADCLPHQVSTKGLSFKHVDVDGTKFIVLDSEGSYAPVKVEISLDCMLIASLIVLDSEGSYAPVKVLFGC